MANENYDQFLKAVHADPNHSELRTLADPNHAELRTLSLTSTFPVPN